MMALGLALAFLLELALLGSAGYWGFTLDGGLAVRLVAGLGAPLLIAVLWGVFGSPRATVPLPTAGKYAFQAACFVTGGILLALAGRPVPGAALAAVWAVNTVLLHLGGDPA